MMALFICASVVPVMCIICSVLMQYYCMWSAQDHSGLGTVVVNINFTFYLCKKFVERRVRSLETIAQRYKYDMLVSVSMQLKCSSNVCTMYSQST